MSIFEKWTGPVLMGGVAAVGIGSAVIAEWRFDRPFADGATQQTWQGQFDDALVIGDPSIVAWGTVFWDLFGQTSAGAVAGADGWLFTDEEYVARDGYHERLNARIAEIIATRAELSEQGIEVVIALLPDKARIMPEMVTRPRPAIVEERYDVLLSRLGEAGANVLDLRPALTEAKQVGPVFLRTDTHWTPFGAQTVAAAIAPQIQALTDASDDFETEQRETVMHQGDLMAFLPVSEKRAAAFGEQPLAQFVTVSTSQELFGGDALFGDAPQLGTLIGTSFSANANWHFEGWLKQESGLDILNLADEGQGPFAPMRAFLADADAIAETTAGVVIWEIPERYVTLDDQ